MKHYRSAAIVLVAAMLFTLISCDRWPETTPSASSTFPPFVTSDSLEPTTNQTSETSTFPDPSESTSEAEAIKQTRWSGEFKAATISAEALEAVADASGTWKRWPALSTLPVSFDIDLSAYLAAPKNESVLKDLVVILDPGHGGKDPGAIGVLGDQTIYEKDINLAIALQTKRELENLGAAVILTRSDDSWVSLYSRIAIAGFTTLDFWEEGLARSGMDSSWIMPIRTELRKLVDINEDTVESGGRGFAQGMGVQPVLRMLFDAQVETDQIIYIAIHANSSDTTVADKRGLQMYISTNQHIYESELSMIQANSADPEVLPINPNYTSYDDAARLKLANSLFSSITTEIPALKQSDISAYAGNYAFLREMNLTNVLVETAFMSNSEDLAILTDPAKQASFARGIADGVWRYFSD